MRGQVRIEGLQALKPILADELFGSGTNDHNWASFKEGFSQSDGYVLAPEKRSGRPVNLNVTNSSGINLEVNLIENTEDPEVRSGHWVVESIQAAVKEPVKC